MNAPHKQSRKLRQISRRLGLLFAKAALTKAICRLCVGDIPRSGIEARSVNCWTVQVLKDNEPFFAAHSCQGLVVRGSAWDSSSKQYSGDRKIYLARLRRQQIEFIHYWGIHRIRASGVANYYLTTLTRIPYLVAYAKQISYLIRKRLFNLKAIEESDRDRLLEYLVSQYAFSQIDFHVHDLLTKRHSTHWFGHPDADSVRQKTEYILSSLCATGELTKNPHQQYRVQPLAMSTMTKTREADLRHRASMKAQWLSIVIGFAVMLTSLIEAGIVRVPCLLVIGEDSKTRAEDKCLINK